jgi:hypothetical protein
MPATGVQELNERKICVCLQIMWTCPIGWKRHLGQLINKSEVASKQSRTPLRYYFGVGMEESRETMKISTLVLTLSPSTKR